MSCWFFHKWENVCEPFIAVIVSTSVIKGRRESEVIMHIEKCTKCGTEQAYFVDLNNNRNNIDVYYAKKLEKEQDNYIPDFFNATNAYSKVIKNEQ